MQRILVVDDDVPVLTALTRVLKSEGYEVIAHQQPLRALQERDYALVITDFMMPELNGLELLGRIKEINPRAVRVMLTAAGDFRIAAEAVNRDAVYRLLAKPWTIEELLTTVRQALEHQRLLEENARLSREVAHKNSELVQMNSHLERLVTERTTGLLEGMISALDFRDTETQWHSRRVSLYARRVGQELGLGAAELDDVEQGALLHDIGKIGVRDSILLKPGPLTPEEWVEMRKHPEMGERMLARIPYLQAASVIVLQHQERWDGKGYPAGLAGPQICLGARIFSVVDAIDAMTSDRPYRKRRSLAAAREELSRCRGTQFDPDVVDAFLRVPDEEWDRIHGLVETMEHEDVERERKLAARRKMLAAVEAERPSGSR